MQMNVWALRHKSTGNWLPARKSRGFSHDEPQPNGGKLGPRLFFSEHSARCALTSWLMGKFENHFSNSLDGQEWNGVISIPQPNRKRAAMEIVKFKLIELRS